MLFSYATQEKEGWEKMVVVKEEDPLSAVLTKSAQKKKVVYTEAWWIHVRCKELPDKWKLIEVEVAI